MILQCVCPDDERHYTNDTCQLLSPCTQNLCENNSTCITSDDWHSDYTYTCNCSNTGYIGDRCNIEIDECIDVFCQNGGTCIDLVKEFKCQCVDGYTGNYC